MLFFVRSRVGGGGGGGLISWYFTVVVVAGYLSREADYCNMAFDRHFFSSNARFYYFELAKRFDCGTASWCICFIIFNTNS